MNDRKDAPFSEETLNALADGQFTADERAELLARIEGDKTAADALCQIKRTKALVDSAFAEVPPPPRRARPAAHRGWAVAAMLVMVLLVVALMQIPRSGSGPDARPAGDRFVLLDPEGRGQHPARAEDHETRIVFHVVSSTRNTADELLDEVESVLRYYRARGEKLRVEVVANGAGLDLLRAGLSTRRARIHALAQAYPNLTFVACLNTVQRLKVEKGVEIALLPEATVTDSGVAYVVKLQQEGWIYIQV